MGLDLYHLRICEKDEGDMDPIYVSDFAEHPSFIEQHRHLIRHVYEHDLFFSICVFKNENDRIEYLNQYGPSEHTHYIAGSTKAAEEEIKNIESFNNLPADEKFVMSSVLRYRNIRQSETIQYKIFSYPVRSTKQEVFYYKQMGYQRKGMSPSFYEIFRNNSIYINKEDVLKAYEYLSIKKEELPELQELFRKNFIDNFIEGESFMETSW